MCFVCFCNVQGWLVDSLNSTGDISNEREIASSSATKSLAHKFLNQQIVEADTMSANLSSWDLQDLDFGVDLYIDNNAACPAAAPQATSHERQKELNRKAQQRTRQKKKVGKVFPCQSSMHRKPRMEGVVSNGWCLLTFQERSQNIEAQLAETTSQLHTLRLRQRQLEAQNHLLEFASPNRQTSLLALEPQQSLLVSQQNIRNILASALQACTPFAIFSQAEAGELVQKILERSGLIRTQQGAALILTVHGSATEMKTDSIANMTCANLADLYSASSRRVHA